MFAPGIVRPAEQRGHQGRQLVRVWPPQAHGAARPGAAVRELRRHHHQQDPVRQHVRCEPGLGDRRKDTLHYNKMCLVFVCPQGLLGVFSSQTTT